MINKKLQKKLYESLRDCNVHIAAGTEAMIQQQFKEAHKHHAKAISLLTWVNNMFDKIQNDWEGTVPIDEWSS